MNEYINWCLWNQVGLRNKYYQNNCCNEVEHFNLYDIIKQQRSRTIIVYYYLYDLV